jgi:hypothetical protein
MLYLTLPPPFSVNKSKRIDWSGHKERLRWVNQADRLVLAAGGMKSHPKVAGPYEVTLTIDRERTGIDLDNAVKVTLDYCVSRGLVEGDGPRFLQKLTVLWGAAPTGMLVLIKPPPPAVEPPP